MVKTLRSKMMTCFFILLVVFLLTEFSYYADRLIFEFKETEKVETLPIDKISDYHSGSTDALWLQFRYIDTKTGNEYSNSGIYTEDTSYKVGDMVEVVTRDGCPKQLLIYTKRKRARTVIERIADTGYDCGMIVHIIINIILLVLIGIPNKKVIKEEYNKSKKFIVKMTLGLLATSIFGSALYIIGIHTGGWDGLGTTFIAMVIYILGLIINVLGYLIRAIKERI